MEREEAIDKLQDLWNEVYNEDSDGYDYAVAIDTAIEALQREDTLLKSLETNEPTYDMVDVVRCKDCRYLEEYRKDAVPVGEVAVYRTMQGWRCMRLPTIYSFVEKEDYCSYGERKGGDPECL